MGDEEEETSLMEDIEEEDMMNQIKPRPVFQSFPQAVGKINIKTVAQIDPRFAASEDPHDDESDSVFHNMLVHWSELDLSEGFGSILRKVRSLSRTLAMTVYNGDRIFTCLKEHALDKERPLELYLESLYQVRPLTQFFSGLLKTSFFWYRTLEEHFELTQQPYLTRCFRKYRLTRKPSSVGMCVIVECR